MRRNRERMILFLLTVLLTFGACGSKQEATQQPLPTTSVSQERVDTGFVVTDSHSYDSEDTAILVEKNTKENTLTFWNRTVGRRYTLVYDGTTGFYDKYGESMSVSQMEKGDIVDVTFLKSTKHLTTMKLSSETWKLEKVTYYDIDTIRGEITVGQETKKYKLSKNTQVYSDGQSISLMELNPVDIVSFQGIDSEVLTIKVEQGHGYLRLIGDEKFIGGWLEIGQSQIHRITEDMLLPVAEGSYRVLISKDGNRGEKSAVIHRNEECILDIGDIHVADPEKGTVFFSLTPSTAQLFIDGEKVDTSFSVTLLYGLHQLIVKADGYQTITQYLKVGQASAGVDITLDPVRVTADEDELGTTAESYKVYIDAPAEVEVYVDGNYVGITPCSFRKEAGSHVVTLRKTGFSPKSYTLQLKDDKKDISYSFAELENASQTVEEVGSLNDIVSDVFGVLIN